jgi:signal transduction histidine kinase
MRVLIVDDHERVRRSVREALGRTLGEGVFAEAGGAGEALRLVQAEPWDVVLLDLSLPDRNGVETLGEIHRLRPALPVLVMSMHPEAQYGPATRAAGAAGYLMKGADPEAIAEAVRGVLPSRTEPLQRAYDDLGRLARRQEVGRDDERRSLARALHDDLGQTLTAAKISLQLARTAPPEEMGRRAGEAIELVDRAIESVRRLGLQLRPPLLDELGLGPAVAAFLAGLEPAAREVGLILVMERAADPGRLAPELEIAGFRIVEEAVTNVLRHAGARRATVKLARGPRALDIEVGDDGHGFDASAPSGRLGLVGIRERARALGGACTIDAGPAGTTVRVALPAEAP